VVTIITLLILIARFGAICTYIQLLHGGQLLSPMLILREERCVSNDTVGSATEPTLLATCTLAL